MRSVQLGPTFVDVADTLTIGIFFNIPSGAILTYASISPFDLLTPRIANRIAYYRTQDEPSTSYTKQLVPLGYSYATLIYRVGVVWEGRLQLPPDWEHILELSTNNKTGATVRMQGTCIYEVEDGIID